MLSVCLLILLTGGWVSYSVFETGISIERVNLRLTDKQLPSLSYISELKRWIVEYERVLYEQYATTDNRSYERESIYAKLSFSNQAIKDNLRSLSRSIDSRNDVKELERIFRQLRLHAEKLDQALPPVPYDWDEAREELIIISSYGREAIPFLNNLSQQIETQIEESRKHSNQQLSRMSIWVFAFSALILLIAILVGYYFRKSTLQAIERPRLGLFVEKNPNPVACINYDGTLEFENISWGKQSQSLDLKKLIERIYEQTKILQKEAVDFVQINMQQSDKILELSIHKVDSLKQYMVYVENVTEREVARRDLEFMAYHDSLTGLPNLKKLETELDGLIQLRGDSQFCLMSVGVRRLHLITTTHGHSVGDALIKALAMRIQHCLSEIICCFDICRLYRFTGAKFEVLLAGDASPEIYRKSVALLADKIYQVSQKPLQTSFGQFFLDVQSGYALYPEHGKSGTSLIKNASAALNEAQKNNLKKINEFDHELAVQEQNWYQLENDMRKASFEQSFYLVYQPKVNLESQQLVGMEALVRWQHPRRGLVSPVEFIPIAEESGMILALGEWILETAIRQTRDWVINGKLDIQVAVNVSPSQLLSFGFAEKVFSILDKHGLTPEYLEIEITEEVMVEDKSRCIQVLQQLKEGGISIAVDDFGTGYSSLGYLNRFPLSKLKIDRSFIIDIHNNEGNQAIVRTIIALSKSLGIKVIAEGIESQLEADILTQLGCHQGQGYLFATPYSCEDFSQHYLSKN